MNLPPPTMPLIKAGPAITWSKLKKVYGDWGASAKVADVKERLAALLRESSACESQRYRC